MGGEIAQGWTKVSEWEVNGETRINLEMETMPAYREKKVDELVTARGQMEASVH